MCYKNLMLASLAALALAACSEPAAASPKTPAPEEDLSWITCTVVLSDGRAFEEYPDMCQLDFSDNGLQIQLRDDGALISLRGSYNDQGDLEVTEYRSTSADGPHTWTETTGSCYEGHGTYTCALFIPGGAAVIEIAA